MRTAYALDAATRTTKAMTHDHPAQTVGRQFPKQWIIGKTLDNGKFVSKPKQKESDGKKV